MLLLQCVFVDCCGVALAFEAGSCRFSHCGRCRHERQNKAHSDVRAPFSCSRVRAPTFDLAGFKRGRSCNARATNGTFSSYSVTRPVSAEWKQSFCK